MITANEVKKRQSLNTTSVDIGDPNLTTLAPIGARPLVETMLTT